MRNSLLLLLTGIVFLGCTPGTRTEQKESTETGGVDSIALAGFEIEVVLDRKATERLVRDKETIIVQAYLSGIPRDTAMTGLNEMGMINLGSPHRELAKPGVALFEKIRVSKFQYESLKTQDFEVLINVFSGRKSSENNLLSVDLLQEPLSKVQGKRHTLKGRLID